MTLPPPTPPTPPPPGPPPGPPPQGPGPSGGPYGGPPPYRPPAGPSGPRAGFWIRFAAALIDGLILSAVSFLFRFGVGAFIGFGISTGLGIAYFGFCEGGPSGQSIGKKVLDIRVVRQADAGPLGWGTAIVRHVCSWLSAIPCGLGYFWMLWDPEKMTWHDKLSSTVVVPASVMPPPPDSFLKPPAN
jgi:uncharacterized RDD family membrane protein YckC